MWLWAVVLHLVLVDAVASDSFPLLGGGYCEGPQGSRVASLKQGSFERAESVNACGAKCGRETQCDGFEFEDEGQGCRLLKGEIEKASGDHGPFRNINCHLNGRKAAAKKAKAEAESKKKTMDQITPDCNLFKCPIGQVRVPKRGWTPWSYGCLNSADQTLNECCIAQDVCLRTCGLSSQYCFSSFVGCATKLCTDHSPGSSCVERTVDVIWEIGRTTEERCAHYEDAQSEACGCVAQAEFRSTFEQWLEDFYAKHQPDKLLESGKLNNSEQIWKKWTGREPELIVALLKKYKGAVDRRQADEEEAQYLATLRKNAIDEEDYIGAKLIKRREALVARKLKASSEKTANAETVEAQGEKMEASSESSANAEAAQPEGGKVEDAKGAQSQEEQVTSSDFKAEL